MFKVQVRFTDKITWVKKCKSQEEVDCVLDHLRQSDDGKYEFTNKPEKKFAVVQGGAGRKEVSKGSQ